MRCGDTPLRVLHTPGHTRGSICLYAPGHLFSGDTLFAGSVGRTDLLGGDARALAASIREKLAELPDETVVLSRSRRVLDTSAESGSATSSGPEADRPSGRMFGAIRRRVPPHVFRRWHVSRYHLLVPVWRGAAMPHLTPQHMSVVFLIAGALSIVLHEPLAKLDSLVIKGGPFRMEQDRLRIAREHHRRHRRGAHGAGRRARPLPLGSPAPAPSGSAIVVSRIVTSRPRSRIR